jgi:hypothetical protein
MWFWRSSRPMTMERYVFISLRSSRLEQKEGSTTALRVRTLLEELALGGRAHRNKNDSRSIREKISHSSCSGLGFGHREMRKSRSILPEKVKSASVQDGWLRTTPQASAEGDINRRAIFCYASDSDPIDSTRKYPMALEA